MRQRCHGYLVVAGILAMLLGLSRPAVLVAQQGGQIAGLVSDSSTGQPVPGVQVVVAGTTLGGVTRVDGAFTITNVPAGTYTLQFRRIGFSARDVPNVVVATGATATVNARIRNVPLQLEAMVTTGVVDPTSGTRVPFTVGRLDAANAPVPATNAVENLQGKMAGVSILPSGQPGSGTSIVLRSPTSINGSNSPLIVVDGVILSQSFGASTADLEGLDIESIEVVKGAAAASLYGSRASSGVIEIRTRRGATVGSGDTRVTARSEVGMNSLAGSIPWARQHPYLVNEQGEYVNATGTVVDRSDRVQAPVFRRFQDNNYIVPVYDQVDAFFDPGQVYKNSIGIAQNGERTNWFASFVGSKEDGVVLGRGAFRQNSIRLNLDHRLPANVTLQFSGYHMRANREEIGAPFFPLVNQAPDIDLLAPDPVDGSRYTFQPDPLGREANPLYALSNVENTTARARTQGSLAARYAPLSWVTFDANMSYDRSDRRGNYFLDAGVRTGTFPAGSPGTIEQSVGTTDAINAAASINFLGRFRQLTVRTTARALLEREDNQITDAEGTTLSVPGVSSLDNAQTRFVSSTLTGIRTNGYFVSTGLDYGGRYIFDGLIRQDGSSLFGPEERWNTYYRVSGSYLMAEEEWWPFESVSQFKLRASRGTAGGRPGFNDQFETYVFTAGGGLEKQSLGNRFLKPELATETEFGLDAIIRDRFSVQLSYARSRVVDQLIQIPLAGMFGYSSQWQNAGTVEGNTIEGTIEAQLVTTPRLSWRMGLVADRSRNEITEFDRSCFTTATIAYRCAGETLGAMYGFAFARGVNQLPGSAQTRASEFQTNDDGLLVWVGPGNSYTQGETDRLWGTSTTIGSTTYGWGQPITRQDSTGSPAVMRIGDGNAGARVGLSNDVTWRDLRIYALVDVQFGGDVYHGTRQRMYQHGIHGDVDQAGKPQELKKTIDYYVNLYNGNNVVDYFVEDASYAKLREVSLGYTLPARLLSPLARVGVSRLQLSVIGRNLFTITDYSGYDPEVALSTNSLVRLDSFTYPRYRTVTAAIDLTF